MMDLLSVVCDMGATRHLKCGSGEQGTEFFVVFNFNLNPSAHAVAQLLAQGREWLPSFRLMGTSASAGRGGPGDVRCQHAAW